jgi:hypothetical protein
MTATVLAVIGTRLGPDWSSNVLAAEAAPSHDVLASLGRAQFAAVVGQTFHIYTETGRSVAVVLAAVVEPTVSPPRYRQPRLECFTLLFRGPRQALPSHTYLIEHQTLGRFPLFLVPTAVAGEYVAVINRLLI